MTKRFLIAAIAVSALLAAGCGKDDPVGPSDDPGKENSGQTDDPGKTEEPKPTEEPTVTLASSLVGKWSEIAMSQSGDDEQWLVDFKEDGTCIVNEYDWETESYSQKTGTWSVDEKAYTLTVTPAGEETSTCEVELIGGGAWLALIYDYQDENWRSREVMNLHKLGADVKSKPIPDGRWDAPHNGFPPESYDKTVDYRFSMIVEGDKVDLYILPWGMHLQGKYTQDKGMIALELDQAHVWQAAYMESDGAGGGWIGWSAWGPPSEDYEDTWDYDCGGINPETLEPQSPYQWYSIEELLAMGVKPDDDTPLTFDEILWEYADNLWGTAREFERFDLCVNEDGTRIYCNVVGLVGCMYKR